MKTIGRRVLVVSVLLFCFMLSLDLLTTSFVALGNDTLIQLLKATDNPFVGLFIGILVTAIVQSSSTSTSMTVALVAADAISLHNAIPIVMGANIGTTVTSALVSLSHVSKKNEFRKAIAAAISHNFFNISVTLLLFPLELKFHFLRKVVVALSSEIYHLIPKTTMGLMSLPAVIQPSQQSITSLMESLFGKPQAYYFLLFFSLILLLASIRGIAVYARSILIDSFQERITHPFLGNPIKALGSGFLATSIVQSSSITTALVVPLVGTGRLSVVQVFPFILGANLGTTVTALLASFYKPELALSIALVHVLFNLIGVLLFFPSQFMRSLPVQFGRAIGRATVKNRAYGFVYIVLVFFIIPFMLIFISLRTLSKASHPSPNPAQEIRSTVQAFDDRIQIYP